MRPAALPTNDDQQAKYEQTQFSSCPSPHQARAGMHAIEARGLGYEEIADVLQIRSGTVGALLARGLKKIRESDLFTPRRDARSNLFQPPG